MVVLGGSASWSGVVSRVEAGGWLFRVGARILVAFFRGLGSGDSCFGGIRGLDWRFFCGLGRGDGCLRWIRELVWRFSAG